MRPTALLTALLACAAAVAVLGAEVRTSWSRITFRDVQTTHTSVPVARAARAARLQPDVAELKAIRSRKRDSVIDLTDGAYGEGEQPLFCARLMAARRCRHSTLHKEHPA
jgi:hypothetical protein